MARVSDQRPRQSLSADILIVGGGAAGLAAACTDRPWTARACGRGAPGNPCPVWNNRIDEDNEPELSEGFIVDIKREDR
jgi:hypothetical protein